MAVIGAEISSAYFKEMETTCHDLQKKKETYDIWQYFHDISAGYCECVWRVTLTGQQGIMSAFGLLFPFGDVPSIEKALREDRQRFTKTIASNHMTLFFSLYIFCYYYKNSKKLTRCDETQQIVLKKLYSTYTI